jgi:hypothetical protein
MNTSCRQLFLLVNVFITSACGPSREQHEAILKEHEDSVRVATEKRMVKLQDLKNSIVDFEAQEEGNENRISVLRARLEVEKDRLVRVKGFQLMRSNDERERQIHDHVLVIDQLEKDIAETGERILEIRATILATRSELATLDAQKP